MSGALKTLLRALKGEVGMSAMLEDLGTALFNGVLPSSWIKLTPQTEKTLGFSFCFHHLHIYTYICMF